MVQIKTTTKSVTEIPEKYVRVILTEEKGGSHKFIETKDGWSEYKIAVGAYKDITPRKFVTLVRTIVQSLKNHQVEYAAVQFQNTPFPKLAEYGDEWVLSTIAENILLADYNFRAYKTKKSTKKQLKEILLCGGMTAAQKKALQHGEVVATYVNKARDIANTPGDDLTPSKLADAAKDIAKGTKIKTTVLDEKGIKKEGLHALWAVGKGADDKPRFIVMEYWGAGKPTKQSKGKQPLVLVGKGITYDTGGLNVKPSGGMHEMHLDMSGGASVIGAIAAVAKLGLKKNVVAIIPAAENAVSDRAMRAGDIINSHAGKTIEVLHTDAEGRLVLADGLSYAAKYKPRAILDVATLTGAALVALGRHASAILTENIELQTALAKYSEESGDYVWPLPLWDEYKTPLTKTRADVANIYPNFSRYAGTIEGAAFLSFFAPKCPWAHIDIAPRMDSVTTDKLAKGSTGEPVRLLVKFLENY